MSPRMRVGADLIPVGSPPRAVTERPNEIHCGECEATFVIVSERFVRAMHEAGWRIRWEGEGLDAEAVNLCPSCAASESDL